MRVIDSQGRTHLTPVAEERAVRQVLSSVVGAQLSAGMLSRMCLPAVAEGEDASAMTRPDVLHPCDIAEDVTIAYNNIAKVIPRVATEGRRSEPHE